MALDKLNELIDLVYIETNRPDLVRETRSAVIASTQKMHNLDFFFKDTASAELIFDSEAYLQTLDTNVLARFKNIAQIRKWNTDYSSSQQDPALLPPLFYGPYGIVGPKLALDLLTPVSPDAIFDNFGYERVDVYYQLGSTLMMKSSTSLKRALLIWYQFPLITADDYKSWIANEYPYAIVYDAASAILQKTGMQDVARKYDSTDPANPGLVCSHMFALQRNNIVVQGY